MLPSSTLFVHPLVRDCRFNRGRAGNISQQEISCAAISPYNLIISLWQIKRDLQLVAFVVPGVDAEVQLGLQKRLVARVFYGRSLNIYIDSRNADDVRASIQK